MTSNDELRAENTRLYANLELCREDADGYKRGAREWLEKYKEMSGECFDLKIEMSMLYTEKRNLLNKITMMGACLLTLQQAAENMVAIFECRYQHQRNEFPQLSALRTALIETKKYTDPKFGQKESK
jgi:hypothetical protein